MKRLIPRYMRLNLKLFRRFLKDKRSTAIFAKRKQSAHHFSFSISEKQPIKPSNYFQNKVDNIKLGAKYIQEITIEPGQTFSFWKAIGNPTRKRGFKIGRNLIAGKLTTDYGGGLCQLSGIIYLTSLKSGLDITERHNHTIDIYREDERFTPLGSDATVVYAYKDLRVKNIHPYPIRFVFEVDNHSIECRLMSEQKIDEKQIRFAATQQKGGVTVETYRDDILCDVSHYLRHE